MAARVRLVLRLDGPARLSQLDKVVVRICEGEPVVIPEAGGPVQNTDTVVWGPYHRVPYTGGNDLLGRTSGEFSLCVGEERVLELEPSPRPSWMPDEQAWADQYLDTPIRLEIECSRHGYSPWTVLVEGAQPQPTNSPRCWNGRVAISTCPLAHSSAAGHSMSTEHRPCP